MKSNITIASNIYHRENSDVSLDPNFIAQIKGRQAIKKIKDRYGDLFSGVKLSSWQEVMYGNDNGCLKALNGEMTHGLIRKNGELVWEGRCEYSQCPDFCECEAAARFNRGVPARDKIAERETVPLKYVWLGLDNTGIDNLFHDETMLEQPDEEAAPPESVIADIKTFASSDEYERLDDPIGIIGAGIKSKVLVNAAPGSGKTYTVIRRLEYIIRNRLADDFSSVLVLVYTNAARNEILNRLEAGVQEGTLPFSAKSADVCTFDSLATSYLSAVEAKFAHLDYNARIKLFNDKFAPENFSNFEYVIVDELQDLVNERAKMVLNILGALKGGYLLLGDKCQAIYDYDCRGGDDIGSVEFYKRLEALLPESVKKYELGGNQRQVPKLANISDNLRSALFECNPAEANELIAGELKKIVTIGKVEQFDFQKVTKRAAILCRNNGEAEYVSDLLHKQRVSHNLLRSVGYTPSLQRFIADCLWDYHADSRITKPVFTERYRARVDDDKDAASEAFDVISETVYGDIKESVEIERLAQVLSGRAAKLPALLLNENNASLTVSTVHKAKGREFDAVYLLNGNFIPATDNTEEARVWYVGCTRAKEELYKLTMKKIYLKRSKIFNSRWTQLKNHRVAWTQKLLAHCRHIVLGLPSDVSESGFVMGNLTAALKIQEYIASKVKVGDNVDIKLADDKYLVRHGGHIVGCLSDDMLRQLRGIARESVPSSGTPPFLSPVYVSNIVTITPSRFLDEAVPYFRESRFWLGLELTGFPKIDWRYAKSKVSRMADETINAYSGQPLLEQASGGS